MKSSRRWLLLVTCLALGAAINIAVALGCWEMASRSFDKMDREPGFLTADQSREFWQRWRLPNWPDRPDDGSEMHGFGWQMQHAVCSAALKPKETFQSWAGVTEWRQGWPLETLGTQFLIETPSADSKPDVEVIHNQTIVFGWRIPTGPIWSGLIVNTVFYAAIAWLMIRGPWETRRRWREWHGRCGACGYPFGTSAVCTECGRAVPKQKAQPQKLGAA